MKKIYIWPALVVVIFVVVELNLPKPINWTPTYSQHDKNPFGSYALVPMLADWFKQQPVTIGSTTFYELDSIDNPQNYLVISSEFSPDSADAVALLNKVEKGASAVIISESFYGSFRDMLGFKISGIYTDNNAMYELDSLTISLYQKEYANFTIPNNYASYLDSLPASAQELASLEGLPVMASLPYGEGQVIISTQPRMFTNYFLLPEKSRNYARMAFGYLPDAPLHWTEFYQSGRRESGSDLRFILSNPSLRWAYFLGMFLLVTFVAFGVKRRQRIIPIVKPPANTSLKFAYSLSRLYYRQKNHLDLAHKRITYLMEYLRERYGIAAYSSRYHQEWVKRLAGKSGHKPEEVEQLLQLKTKVDKAFEEKGTMSEKELLKLNSFLDSFQQSAKEKINN